MNNVIHLLRTSIDTAGINFRSSSVGVRTDTCSLLKTVYFHWTTYYIYFYHLEGGRGLLSFFSIKTTDVSRMQRSKLGRLDLDLATLCQWVHTPKTKEKRGYYGLWESGVFSLFSLCSQKVRNRNDVKRCILGVFNGLWFVGVI